MKMYAHTMIRRPISDIVDYLTGVLNDVQWRHEIILGEVISAVHWKLFRWVVTSQNEAS